MTENAVQLSTEQKELVAVGASVGAGCHPCVKHHVKTAVEAGVNEERLIAALTSSDRIAAEATKRMVAHSRGVLGADPTATAVPSSALDGALASFGAAIAANDKTAIEAQLAAAQAAGATKAQLEQAVQTAAKVQENAARIICARQSGWSRRQSKSPLRSPPPSRKPLRQRAPRSLGVARTAPATARRTAPVPPSRPRPACWRG
jgi:AhpD family alkylhydroperoxidase